MAQKKVIVKRLSSIENFGSMNIICSDKTGTLTDGTVQLQSALNADGGLSDKVFLYSYLNAFYQTGFSNPIDEAIRNNRKIDISGYQKLDEIPYDFLRKRLSILTIHDNTNLMVTKGALKNILDVCTNIEKGDGTIIGIDTEHDNIQKHFEEFSNKGFRTLGVAYKMLGSESRIGKDQEAGMTFSGFLILFDPPKPNIIDTITNLRNLGVALKVITGDNHLVAANVSQQMGLKNTKRSRNCKSQ
jgi:Mg2+-importing ATPase